MQLRHWRTFATLGNVADIACAHGFADQAHLSREVKLWFGMTPGTVMAQSGTAYLLREPGYASG